MFLRLAYFRCTKRGAPGYWNRLPACATVTEDTKRNFVNFTEKAKIGLDKG